MNKMNNRIAAAIIMVAAILLVNSTAFAKPSVLDQIIEKAMILAKTQNNQWRAETKKRQCVSQKKSGRF